MTTNRAEPFMGRFPGEGRRKQASDSTTSRQRPYHQIRVSRGLGPGLLSQPFLPSRKCLHSAKSLWPVIGRLLELSGPICMVWPICGFAQASVAIQLSLRAKWSSSAPLL